ncbi:crotonobetainyl-CoA:carnitine CoA-transferase CaiB-like acyl-CoA transferase [Antricoccus suffuscus]|uniref:Crotonobetainyl-CoA:carnitine CoA-transferase CaiB-like acyl-CoA transferase n=1 Tax=Antricoccus suffuscus TaxID=1629062 RepID=A0A2T1A068_9ACTN|nr:CoA transferase [Antricoccus suffuscus]PRZ41877.1 crotonobetainyl-CoA:carnitine CoA-transferase CaiB-like acyl-CoA transferase [Antricoccus suffuscus]
MVAPLDGLRVVDFSTGIASAATTMHLADYGADVVRVEPADGAAPRDNPGFATWDRNKRLVVVDPTSDDGRANLAKLVAGADVCVSGRLPGEVVDPASLSQLIDDAANDRLIRVEMPAFLGECPWAGGHESNEMLSAELGVSLRQSSFADGPVDPVYTHILYLQGLWSAACTVAALSERAESGRGQTVTVGGAHGATIAGYATLIIDPAQIAATPPAGPGGPNPTYTRYQCGDGEWLFLGALTEKFQLAAFDALGVSDIVTDPRLGGDLDGMLLVDNREWVRTKLADVFATKPRSEWLDTLERVDVPAGPLQLRDDWLDHPQVRAIGMHVEVDDPERGKVVMPGVPMVLTESPGAVRTPAPNRAQAEVTVDWPSQTPAAANDAASAGPLAGLKVLNLGTVLAGPLAGNLLCELGADVLKIEPPAGDSFRVKGFAYNRGMRSIALDLRNEDALDAFYELVRSADVVIDNYRPGVLQRLKIDHETLAKINPGIICLSFTGYGEGGPLSNKPGFDPILQGTSGMMSAQGGDSEPVFLTVAVNDITSAVFGALSVALALYRRRDSGRGQRIWGSLAGTSVAMQSGELTRFDGRPPARIGGADYRGPEPLDRLYAAKDGWLRLQATQEHVPALVELGLLQGAVSERELEQSFADRSRDEVVDALTARGVPVARARTTSELLNQPEIMDVELMQEQTRPNGKPYFAPGRLAFFSRTQRDGAMSPPGLGEHTRAILADAGYDESQIETLLRTGAAIEGPPMALETFVSYR